MGGFLKAPCELRTLLEKVGRKQKVRLSNNGRRIRRMILDLPDMAVQGPESVIVQATFVEDVKK
jgi:hypothetical protein